LISEILYFLGVRLESKVEIIKREQNLPYDLHCLVILFFYRSGKCFVVNNEIVSFMC
jgi:hypothetical protein